MEDEPELVTGFSRKMSLNGKDGILLDPGIGKPAAVS
jgi:hypothetical protein